MKESEYDSPETDYREYRETWLRVAKNINQAGRPVLLYGSAVSSQFEQCSERRFFARIHTLALVCEPDILAGRLRARPSWRSADGDEFIQNMLNFNRWLIDHSSSELSILDTSNASLEDTASAILRWAAGYWHAPFQERMEI